MEALLQDLCYALRQLRKAPEFTLTAVITLAVGIGANTAIFTLVHGILLRLLPVADPARCYRIGDTDDCCVSGGFVGDNGDFDIFSYDLCLHLKNSAPEFEQLAAVQQGSPIGACAAEMPWRSRCPENSSLAITSPRWAWEPMRDACCARATTLPRPLRQGDQLPSKAD